MSTLSLLRRVGAFVPSDPDNEARDCWRCPHRWHGLRCDTNSCGCSSSWVDPDVLARLRGVAR